MNPFVSFTEIQHVDENGRNRRSLKDGRRNRKAFRCEETARLKAPLKKKLGALVIFLLASRLQLYNKGISNISHRKASEPLKLVSWRKFFVSNSKNVWNSSFKGGLETRKNWQGSKFELIAVVLAVFQQFVLIGSFLKMKCVFRNLAELNFQWYKTFSAYLEKPVRRPSCSPRRQALFPAELIITKGCRAFMARQISDFSRIFSVLLALFQENAWNVVISSLWL